MTLLPLRLAFKMVCAAACLALAATAIAQTEPSTPARMRPLPFDTNPCELVANPDKYNQTEVMAEGLLLYGADIFTLNSQDCGGEHGQIWLEFGGDVGDPTATAKPLPGTNIKIDGGEIYLVRDKKLASLRAMLDKMRASGSDKMLRVELTGKFFAGKAARQPDGSVRYRGYGRAGCCSLLVIEQVEIVGTEIEDGRTLRRTLRSRCRVRRDRQSVSSPRCRRPSAKRKTNCNG
jgi:hypothetical protein